MRYGSLCSGIGGLDLAVESVFGATPGWFCEADPHAASVLRHHWPNVPVLPDLKTQDWTTVEPVELVCAGYPCQPFSFAGRRAGTDDPRHLWPYVAAAVRVLRPRIVVLENVAGHLGLGFDEVLCDLAALGFDAEWTTVRASDAGACHRRERLFVVAHDTKGVPGFFEHRERLRAAPDAERADGRTTARERRTGRKHMGEAGRIEGAASPGRDRSTDADADSGRLEGGAELDSDPAPGTAHRSARREHADRCRDAAPDSNLEGSQGPEPTRRRILPAGRAGVAPDADDIRVNGGGIHGDGGPNLRTVVADATGEGRRRSGRASETLDGPEPVAEPRRFPRLAWGDYEPAITRWERVLGRAAPEPTDERGRLAVPFVEWMMGFPMGWVDGLTRTAALRCLGNAVVPQQGAHALRLLLDSKEAH